MVIDFLNLECRALDNPLDSGRLLVNGSSFYCGNSTSNLCELALKSDILSVTQYVHPAEKQCNYQYVHPTAKQCNYSYTHPTTKQCNWEPSFTNYIIKAGNGRVGRLGNSASSWDGRDSFEVNYSGFNSVIAFLINGCLEDTRNDDYNPVGLYVDSFNSTTAKITTAFEALMSGTSNMYVMYNWVAIGT